MVQWKMAVFVGRYLLLDIPTSFSLNHDRGREGNDPWKHIPEQTNQQMSHEKKTALLSIESWLLNDQIYFIIS